jgi:hypothetical protein
MMLQQLLAGNADVPGGVAYARPHHRFMLRAFTLTLTFALLALPGSAGASDPLLSGYGGPGGGEQSVLGAETLGGGGSGGDGGSGSSGAAPVDESLRAAAAPAATPQGTATAAVPKLSKKPRRSGTEHRAGATSGSAKGAGTTTAAQAAAPALVSYPSRSTDGGGSPLSGGAVAALLLGLVALVLLGLGLRRLSPAGPQSGDHRTSQVPTA